MSGALIATHVAPTERGPTSWTESDERERRLAIFVRRHHPFVWRVLRRHGLTEADADDAAQQVFMTAARRLEDIAEGSERAFLYRIAVRVCSKAVRAQKRRPESPEADCGEEGGGSPAPDDLIDQRRAREVLDQLLAELQEDFRAVLVLFEIEELTKEEVAEALGIPAGTVASRLRRARAALAASFARRQARFASKRRRP